MRFYICTTSVKIEGSFRVIQALRVAVLTSLLEPLRWAWQPPEVRHMSRWSHRSTYLHVALVASMALQRLCAKFGAETTTAGLSKSYGVTIYVSEGHIRIASNIYLLRYPRPIYTSQCLHSTETSTAEAGHAMSESEII